MTDLCTYYLTDRLTVQSSCNWSTDYKNWQTDHYWLTDSWTNWLIDGLTDWLTEADVLTDWLIAKVTDLLTDWLSNWFMDLLAEKLADFLTDCDWLITYNCLIDYWMADLLDCLTDRIADLQLITNEETDLLMDSLTCCVTGWLAVLLTDWLID